MILNLLRLGLSWCHRWWRSLLPLGLKRLVYRNRRGHRTRLWLYWLYWLNRLHWLNWLYRMYRLRLRRLLWLLRRHLLYRLRLRLRWLRRLLWLLLLRRNRYCAGRCRLPSGQFGTATGLHTLHYGSKDFDQERIPLPSCSGLQSLQGFIMRHRLTIRTVADHGMIRIDNRYDSCRQRNLFTPHSTGKSGAVPALVMVLENLANISQGTNRLEKLGS